METGTAENGCPAGGRECPLAIEVAQLREQCRRLEALSYIDALTGIYNFRYLQRALEMEMERTRRTKLPTSLIMADLDHFKGINGAYGHEAGNAALAWVSRIWRESIRVIDVACRYGGEEFALILPSTSLVQSINIAERLRMMISSNPVILNEQTVTLTASFGVAAFGDSDDWTVSEFMSRADGFLFQAKSLGRNRVCCQEIAPVLPEVGVTQDEKDGLFARIDPDKDESP
ncbi:MAG: GGDEF domain-containing protein [Syntrophobacteraceae bacterium]